MDELEVLRSLRLKGRAGTADIAEASGVDEASAEDMLARVAGQGLASHRTGKRGGWMLTADGRSEVTARLVAERDTVDSGPAAAAYDGEFLALNQEFKQLCTRLQIAPSDDITAELAGIHHRADALLRRLADAVPRYERYRSRLNAAYTRFCQGDGSALLQPLSASYHDIWLELHEDLLLLLNRVRHEDD